MAQTKLGGTVKQLLAGFIGVAGILLWIGVISVFGVAIGAIKTSREGDPSAALRRFEEGIDPTGYSYEGARGSAACTSNCSGHEAGWRWAAEHFVFDPEDRGGKSLSFEEGCRAWAEEQAGL